MVNLLGYLFDYKLLRFVLFVCVLYQGGSRALRAPPLSFLTYMFRSFGCLASSTSCSATLFMALRLWTRSCSGCRMFVGARQALHRVRQFSLWHLGYGHVLVGFARTFLVTTRSVYGIWAMDMLLQTLQAHSPVCAPAWLLSQASQERPTHGGM